MFVYDFLRYKSTKTYALMDVFFKDTHFPSDYYQTSSPGRIW